MTYLNNAHSRDDRMRSILRTWEQYLISNTFTICPYGTLGKFFCSWTFPRYVSYA